MHIRKRILQEAFNMGIDQELLNLYNNHTASSTGGEEHLNQIRKIVDDRIQEYTLNSDERKGYVFLPLTQGQLFNASTYIHCLLAHAFRVRGYEPLVTLCRNDMPLCMRKGSEFNGNGTDFCAICHRYGTQVLDAFGISPLHVSDVLPDDYVTPTLEQFDDLTNVIYKGINVSKPAKSSTRRILQKGRVRKRNEQDWAYYEQFLQTCLLLVDLSTTILETHDVAATVTSAPGYARGAVPLAVSNNNDVVAVSFSKGYRDKSVLFGNFENRCAQPQFTSKPFIQEILEQPLSETENTAVDELMRGRSTGSAVRKNNTPDTSDSLDDGDCQKVGLFTNVSWDSSLTTEDVVFNNSYNWVGSTIEYIADIPDVELLVKAHPAERRNNTADTARIDTWIDQNFDQLPKNVRLSSPETEIDPYKMMQSLDAGIVYTSTVGMELPYFGTPSIVVSDTHYRDLGFTFDAESVQEYYTILDNLNSLTVTEEMQQRVRRYIHFLFIRKHIKFPFYETNAQNMNIHLKAATHDDLRDQNSELSYAIERILDGDPIVKLSDDRRQQVDD
jgi:hypothetical protein